MRCERCGDTEQEVRYGICSSCADDLRQEQQADEQADAYERDRRGYLEGSR